MTAIRFVLAARDTGRMLGYALVAPEARYCSIGWSGETRLDRRHVSAAGWIAIEREVAERLPPTPLAKTSAIVEALLDFGRRSSVAVQWLHALPVEAPPGDVSAALDGILTRERELPA